MKEYNNVKISNCLHTAFYGNYKVAVSSIGTVMIYVYSTILHHISEKVPQLIADVLQHSVNS